MARRPTRDAKGNILPLKQRKPYAYWITIVTSLAVVFALFGSALLLLVQ